jgi:hypothetical protein
MKLRVRHNFVRLRLTQGEVRQLRDSGRVQEVIEFSPDQTLTYRIDASEVRVIRAQFCEGAVSVTVPRSSVIAWADGAQVGMEAQQDTLRITVEKDFACVDPADAEENLDTFPNPTKGNAC